MAFKEYDANFASVLPRLRARLDIVADLDRSVSGGATDSARGMIAEIELHISDGDNFYRRKQYDSALNEFKKARALIYKALHPQFDVGSYIGRKDVVLPVSKAIEESLLDVSLRIADVIRPVVLESGPIFKQNGSNSMPQALQTYMVTGFREVVSLDESLQLASVGGVALLNDNKPEAAIRLMEEALNSARAANSPADSTLTAALELNLSGAYLQLANPQKATELATASLEHFKKSGDQVGQAQALHITAMSAQKNGDTDSAKQLFAQAANILTKVSAPAIGETPMPGGPIPSPTPVAPHLLPGFIPMPLIASRTIRSSASAELASSSLRVALPGDASLIVSRDFKDLQPIATMDAQTLTYRIPGRVDGWGILKIPDKQQQKEQSKAWQVGVPVGEKLVAFQMSGGQLPGVNELVDKIYHARIDANRFIDIDWKIFDPSTTTFYLTQLYAYVLPVKIGDSCHELGQYARAEEYFMQAAGYSYINKQVEATALWIRMARNAFAWGDSLYKNEDLPAAQSQYEKVITDDAHIPDSFLYTTDSLSVPADAARTLIQAIADRPLPEVNWEIAYFILSAFSQIQQIRQGLDFYGLLLSPIHTFEYLQNVARGFAQEAIQAEREFVNFKSRQEMEEATRRELETARAMAQAEAAGRYQQFLAAREDESSANMAWELANKRHDDAVRQMNEYAASSSTQIWSQAAAQAVGMGQDGLYNEISELADKLARGERISGAPGKVAAAETLYGGRKTREYELHKMQNNIDELTAAIPVAKDQWDAARARTAACEIAWQAAVQRAQMSNAALTAFDNEFFTPESWSKMADVMRDISRSYLFQAIRIAKLMERSYNFENDTQLGVIKNEYGHGVASEVPGRDVMLLGGDSLLQDIESFTYLAITNKTRKNSRIKDVISLASSFPAQFEEFRQTGLLSLETDLYEFDRLHPGFYGQRIEAIELEIIGLLPEGGLNGTLTAGGVTSYRKKDGTAGKRVHQVDTMALSDFVLRNDMFLYGAETGVRGLFQGIGTGSTWQIHLPRRSNDFDFRRIFDVHLVVYYTARYDAALRTSVLALPPRPGEMELLRTFGLRYDFPDAWYGFYRDGVARITLDRFKFPVNQQNFAVKTAYFRVITKPGISNSGIDVRITGSSGASCTGTTDANGVISSESPQLAALIDTDPLGVWQVEVTGGASISDGGTLKFDRVYNIQMGLEYAFEYVQEEVV